MYRKLRVNTDTVSRRYVVNSKVFPTNNVNNNLMDSKLKITKLDQSINSPKPQLENSKMIIDVNGSSGVYKVNTDDVTCTCRNFIYKRKGIPLDDPNRLCKHLKSEVESHPELFPSTVVKSLMTLNDIEHKVGIPRSEFLPVIGIMKNLLTDALDSYEIFDVTGEYRLGTPRIDSLDILVGLNSLRKLELNSAMIDALRIQVTKLTETKYELVFKSDGYKIVHLDTVLIHEFPFRQLFSTGPKDEVLKLINESNKLGHSISMTGFQPEVPNITTEEDIYKYLKLPYPFERTIFDSLLTKTESVKEDLIPF